jgi:hypothetical protein
MKMKLLPFFLVMVLLLPFVVGAQTTPCTGGVNGDVGKCVSQIYIWSLGLSGLLAVAVSVFGGYLIMTARGNGAQVARGKTFIYSALTGLVLLLAAYLLLNTINTDLTDFTTPAFETQAPAAPGPTPPTQNPGLQQPADTTPVSPTM